MQRSSLRMWVVGIGGGLVLAGCAGGQRPAPSPIQPDSEAPLTVAQPLPSETGMNTMPVTGMASDWVPPLFISPEEEASYYVSRLADRRFVTSYGGYGDRRPYYIAAERLGEIGLPAISLLFTRLNTADQYELALALYALQLATQDPQLMVQTSGEYIQLGVVLDPAYNADNVAIAQQWWQRHSIQLDR